MKTLELTLPTPAENLALDEALLDQAERGDGPDECLRLWEATSPFVVIGRASRIDQETNRAACAADGVPVLRRTSGGAAIVAGPGCLMYAAVLSYEKRPALRAITEAHCYALGQLSRAVCRVVPGATCQGTSDLTIGERKFSGNSLRCRRSHLLYHGTLLYDFELESIGRYLGTPPRQPDYRGGRSHDEFLCNLPASGDALREALRLQWEATDTLSDWPRDAVRHFVAERYGSDEWNARM